ncbi:MAG: EamA family transporter [Nitrososphaerales archaeon]
MALDWFFLTLLSAAAYSGVDLLEKHLISRRIQSPLMLAIFVAIFYPIILVIIPILFTIDFTFLSSIAGFAIGAGMGMAYLLFMKSIRVEEVSRVVTLHYAYPLFIAPIAFFFLDESLNNANYLGIILLVASTFMISYKKIGREILYSPALLLMTTFNIAIAIENVLAKYLFDFTNFWSFVFWFTAGLIVIRLLLLLTIPRVRNEFRMIKFDRKLIGYGVAISVLFLAANMFYYGAVSLQFVSLVSALSAIQPVFILAMALAISYMRPGFVYEELSRRATLTKAIAVALVFLGTYLLTLNSL